MKGKWRWFGHVLRTTPERTVGDTVSWPSVGVREVGIPRLTWMRIVRREGEDDWGFVEVKTLRGKHVHGNFTKPVITFIKLT